MLDRFNREISYLRISVIDRCNLRCYYCIPSCEVNYIHYKDLITIEEIVEVIKTAIPFGINKVRLTGGEPLLRKDIIDLVKRIADINGLEDLAITTNGILLKNYAESLKKAGLQRVNISLDTIDPEEFKKITNGGDINKVMKGIEAAQNAGLTPVKINAVKFSGRKIEIVDDLIHYCKTNNLQLRFIKQMNLSSGEFAEVEGGEGGNCKNCNRLRLTANGMLKPCLFDNHEFSIRKLGIIKALEFAIENKPECGLSNKVNMFYNIGG